MDGMNCYAESAQGLESNGPVSASVVRKLTMHHIIGLQTSKKTERSCPPPPKDRFIFRTDSFHALGYFFLIAPAFERYAQRDAQISITSMNVLFRLSTDDLMDALAIFNALEIQLCQQPESWQEYLGDLHHPQQEKRPIKPRLFRSRAIRIIQTLRALVLNAQAQDKCLVYGNGVCYRALRGIKMPPGTVYS